MGRTNKNYSVIPYDYHILISPAQSRMGVNKLFEIAMLESARVKYNKDDVIFAVKDKENHLYWLENGNQSSGLNHILKIHSDDFKKVYGVVKHDVPGFIKHIVSSSNPLKVERIIKNGKIFTKNIYKYNDKYVTIVAVGTNGYIVTVFPKKR